MTDIVVLVPLGSFHHVKPLYEHFGNRILLEDDYNPEKVAAHNPKIVIAFEVSDPQRGLCMAEMKRRNIGTLLIADGIIEWRNTWHRLEGTHKRPQNQPALVHKIACLGHLDARLLESWGNVGMCEVVGAPRLDHLIKGRKEGRTEPIIGRPLKLLVTTARTPGFTPEEIEVTLNSLRDLQEILNGRNDIEVIWRISKGLHRQLNVKNTFTSVSGEELHEILTQVDAVITTPSTVQLEAMLLGLPVVILNYHLVPLYTPAAWEIKCKQHILPVLNDLFSPPYERMIYQEFCLNDSLEAKSVALPRLIELIEKMIQIKIEYDLSSEGIIKFPNNLLDLGDDFFTLPHFKLDLSKLYPDHQVFKNQDVVFLQSELDAALITINELKDQVDTLTRRLHRLPGYLLAKRFILKIQKTFYWGGHSKV